MDLNRSFDMTKAQALALERMKPFVAEIVEQKLVEILGDPDSGMRLQPSIRKRIMARIDKSRLVPARQAAARLGLKW
jgi:hypothetical protein